MSYKANTNRNMELNAEKNTLKYRITKNIECLLWAANLDSGKEVRITDIFIKGLLNYLTF